MWWNVCAIGGSFALWFGLIFTAIEMGGNYALSKHCHTMARQLLR
jgi:hypothetical protein